MVLISTDKSMFQSPVKSKKASRDGLTVFSSRDLAIEVSNRSGTRGQIY